MDIRGGTRGNECRSRKGDNRINEEHTSLILSAVDDDVNGLYGGYNDTNVKSWVNTIT